MHRVVGQGQPAEAVHRVGDVDQQRVRHRVARVAHQCVDDLLGVVPGGAGVPQRERRHPVGVHVLGGALQLGERGDRRAAVLRQRVVDLEQQGLVRLDDQGAVTHEALVPLPGSGVRSTARTRAPGGSGTLHRNRPPRRLLPGAGPVPAAAAAASRPALQEDLVHAQLPSLERERAGAHVEPPHPGAALATSPPRRRPSAPRGCAPTPAGSVRSAAQRLDVEHLEVARVSAWTMSPTATSSPSGKT